jgi:CubicO group peptidase (beta-lactamase class C family)
VWDGQRILPDGWVRYAITPTPAAPLGSYGAHWWLDAGEVDAPERRPWPQLPPETHAARGHSGQWVVVVPSARLVVVRLGLTLPDLEDDGTQELVAELLAALR